ncbi:MAG: hypothetical protein ACP5D7_03585 [Limnospira sp.]
MKAVALELAKTFSSDDGIRSTLSVAKRIGSRRPKKQQNLREILGIEPQTAFGAVLNLDDVEMAGIAVARVVQDIETV